MDIFVLTRIYFATQINCFIAFIQKLPLINKVITDGIFSRYKLKNSIAVWGVFFDISKRILTNMILVLIFVRYVTKVFLREAMYTDDRLVVVYVVLFVIYPFFSGSDLFMSGAEDQMFIHYFAVDPDCYYKYKGLKSLILMGIGIIPALACQFGNIYIIIMLVFLTVTGKALTDMVYLIYFKRRNQLPNKRIRKIAGLLCVLVAYFICGFGVIPEVMINESICLVIVLVCLIILMLSVTYILRFKDYKELAIKYADKGIIKFSISTGNDFNPDAAGILDKGSEYNRKYFKKNKDMLPCVYVDKAFRIRYRKEIRDSIVTNAIVYSIILAVLGYVVRIGWIEITEKTISEYSPMLVTAAVSMSLVGVSSRRYFRNIDMIYMKSRMITKKFLQRLMLARYLRTIVLDLVITGVIALGALAFLFISDIDYPAIDFCWLVASVFPILIINDTFEWAQYYFIQPYSVDLVAKSPIFSVIGYINSIVMLLLLFIRANMSVYFVQIMGITMFIIFLFCICSNYAYRTFKIRF